MVLLGLCMIEVSKVKDSTSYIIGLDYPEPQRLLINKNVINDPSQSTELLRKNLPGDEEYF